jgi:lactose/L-arabinose transport system ATP-binding protein
MTSPSLTLRSIKKRFGNTETIHGIDLDIEEGEFVVFVGPSGCGKSTLLRMIAGLEEVTEGAITIRGRDVTHLAPSARCVAMVFQSYALYPHMTVMENLTFGMRMRGVAKETIKQKVDMAVEMLRLQPYLDRKPGALSGGQCQRVAIGRALVQEPDVFLFDEPLSNLDAELRLKTRVEIAALHKRLGKTMIYVTHDQVEAMTLADKIVVLRDGVVEQVGKPLDLYTKPRNEFVAGFIGSPAMNFLPAQIQPNVAMLADGTRIATAVTSIEQQGKLGVRPEHIRIHTNGAHSGIVSVVEKLGATSYVYAHAFGQMLCIESRDAVNLVSAQTIRFDLDASALHVFAAGGQRIDSV